ncbi:MAG: dihydrodipicolinate synthase family protein, partial [Candidatus Nanopelagicales bacterium]
ESLLPVYTGIFRTQGVILTKAALQLQGLPSGPVRPPLVNATLDEINQLRQDLVAGGVTFLA